MRIYLIFDLMNVNGAWSLRILNFANSAVGYENLICFVSIKFDFEEKWIICKNFLAVVSKILRVY